MNCDCDYNCDRASISLEGCSIIVNDLQDFGSQGLSRDHILLRPRRVGRDENRSSKEDITNKNYKLNNKNKKKF